jgi:D-arabinose 1-dehydrogenase-like Zn-dependent alcohol dehydrogenase
MEGECLGCGTEVDYSEVDLHTSQYDLGEINEVAELLENREIDGRAVITT